MRVLRLIFNCAREWGRLPKGSQNPVKGVKFFKETKRRKVLSDIEFQRVNKALMQEPNPYWLAFFPLALLLAVRRDELQSARWENIRLEGDAPTWSIPHTKSGEPHQIPLPGAAVAILEKLPSRGVCDWVFPGRGKTGHLVEPKGAWSRIKKQAGVKDVRIHDLRRTGASMLAGSGYSLSMIGAVLNHLDPKTTAGYAWMQQKPMRAALEDNAAKMMALGLPAPIKADDPKAVTEG